MSFPKQFIQDLNDRTVLSELIGKKVKLTRAGRDEFKGCCPFHNEKTPSFTLNNQKGFYHCFGCGAHGDAIKFLQENDNLSFMEAVEQLAALNGMQVPKASPEERERFEQKKTLYDLLEDVTIFFEQALGHEREAMQYLKGRELSDGTIKLFRLGYAPADGQALGNFLKDKGYAVKDMIEAGVLRNSTRNQGETYSFFRDRIIFPVKDLRGRVVAFGGRIMPGRDPGGKAPKYINSSDTPLFHKGQILYNLSDARKNVDVNKPFIVVEGYMDVIALAQAGYDTAVAPLGTAMTESQIEILWKVAPSDARVPVLCFDGDNAGRRAASRAMERTLPLLKPDQSVRFAFLPDGEDPDSLVQNKGKAEFEKFLSAASYLSQILWEEELGKRPGTTPEDRAGLKAALLSRVNTIEHADVQNEYQRMMTSLFYDHFSGKRQSKTPFSRSNYNSKQQDRLAPIAKKPEPVKQTSFGIEHYLLATLVNYPELFDDVEETLGMIEIQDKNLRKMRQKLFETLNSHEVLDSSELKDILKNAGFCEVLDVILSESLYLQAVFARPGQDLGVVKEGWMFTVNRSRKRRKRL